MRHSHSQLLLDLWRNERGEQTAPRKSAIEPRALKEHLAFAFLLKREAEDKFTFQLAGTGVCDLFGQELRGQSFVHLWADASRNAARTSLIRVSNLSVPTVAVAVGETADLRPMPAEILLLPYADDRGEPTWILGHFQPLEPLSRLLGRKLVRMRMTANAILTGDVHSPSAVAFQDEKRSGLSPRHLKVVSSR
ncbi:MAG: PAS domain-containing protein [Alphaproteobacteria bacterium]|nr:PAS domain-containing protein [Alphaproteobacteria bacterium]